MMFPQLIHLSILIFVMEKEVLVCGQEMSESMPLSELKGQMSSSANLSSPGIPGKHN